MLNAHRLRLEANSMQTLSLVILTILLEVDRKSGRAKAGLPGPYGLGVSCDRRV
jgi:hypothetical protein